MARGLDFSSLGYKVSTHSLWAHFVSSSTSLRFTRLPRRVWDGEAGFGPLGGGLRPRPAPGPAHARVRPAPRLSVGRPGSPSAGRVDALPAPPTPGAALPRLSGPARLPHRRAKWTRPRPAPSPEPRPALRRLCQAARGGVPLRGWGASTPSSRPKPGGSPQRTVRLPGVQPRRCQARRRRGPSGPHGRGAPPPPGSGGWARPPRSVRSEMAEPPRRGPRPRELGSRAARGRGGARGQRGRRPVRRVSCP